MTQQNGFCSSPELYSQSKAHSETEDLDLALSWLPSLDGLEGLDVATGTGHAAFYFARKNVHMFAIDPDRAMLAQAQEESDRKTLAVRFLPGFAEDLNFDDDSFDIVLCRIACHHFRSLGAFLSESRRVLRPTGHLLIVDNTVPEDKECADWINAYERRRDESHQELLSVSAWESLFAESGFRVHAKEPFKKSIDYGAWMERMDKPKSEQDDCWVELLQAPQGVLDFWKPEDDGGRRSLLMRRRVFVLTSLS